MSEVPELQTERLVMRAWRYEDHEPFAAIMADPAVARGLGKDSGLTPHEAWVDMSMMAGHWAIRGFGHWALEERESGEFVGRAGLYYPPDWPAMEVGWTVARKHWARAMRPRPDGPRALGRMTSSACSTFSA